MRKVIIGLAMILSSCGSEIINPVDLQTSNQNSVLVVDGLGRLVGEPFIVFDAEIGKWKMFFTRDNENGSTINFVIAENLTGPWENETRVSELNGFGKMVILVDPEGNPIRIDGNFFAYFIKPKDQLMIGKEIYVSCSQSISGSWSEPEKIIELGSETDPDGANSDAPYAIYYQGHIFIWYMGYPLVPNNQFGMASRLMLAESSSPFGPFQKDGVVLNPSDSEGDWDFGWIGGAQIRADGDGGFWMAYNASNSRPSEPGAEPANSAIGLATSKSIFGPWEKSDRNPFEEATPEKINIWRPHFVFNPETDLWMVFYNTGPYGYENIEFTIGWN